MIDWERRLRVRIAGKTVGIGIAGLESAAPTREVNRLMHAFMAGVKESAPDATFQVAFIGSWKAGQARIAVRRSRIWLQVNAATNWMVIASTMVGAGAESMKKLA